jgi:hypothetical protein
MDFPDLSNIPRSSEPAPASLKSLPELSPRIILKNLVVKIVRNANSPEEATQLANDLLAYLNEHLPSTDWQAEIKRVSEYIDADEFIFGSLSPVVNKLIAEKRESTAAPSVPGKRVVRPFNSIKVDK